MDEILVFLLRHGAKREPVRMTTTELGLQTGMSQQNASRRLKLLEKQGYIERRREGIRLSQKGQDALAQLYAKLKSVFEHKALELSGTIAEGAGEGRYYLSMEGYKRQIKEKLGFSPYPGTLNVRLDEEDIWKRQYIMALEPIVIEGFRDSERTYGDLYAYRCTVEGERCAVIIPLRTHHGHQTIEIISPRNMRKLLGRKRKVRVVL